MLGKLGMGLEKDTLVMSRISRSVWQDEEFCARQLKNKEVFWQNQLKVLKETWGNAFGIKDETESTTIFGSRDTTVVIEVA